MLNTYHGEFDQNEVNILEEYWGYTFWKVEHGCERYSVTDYYGWHYTWKPELRIHATCFIDFLRDMEYPPVYRRPDRITRRDYVEE